MSLKLEHRAEKNAPAAQIALTTAFSQKKEGFNLRSKSYKEMGKGRFRLLRTARQRLNYLNSASDTGE